MLHFVAHPQLFVKLFNYITLQYKISVWSVM